MTSDLDLLRRFARENSQDAFAEIVRRHLNLVYSAALRQVRSPQLAEEVSQSVFADLARNGKNILPVNETDSLAPWLYSVTRRTAIDVIRKESRRQLREQIAVGMQTMNATENSGTGVSPVWSEIEFLLDDAMAALDETDRSAVLLRYFENKSLREVGESLKISDDAAQKRVSRAVEKLREFFSAKKVTIGASGLIVLISANAVQSAPVGLVAAISTAAVLTGTATSISTAITTTKVIAMTTLQKTIIGTAIVVAAGAGIFEAHQNSKLQNQIQTFQQQQMSLTAQIQQLQRERDDATNQIAGLVAENMQLKSNSNEDELLKLRSEVTQLHQELQELPSARVALLKQKLQEMPDKGIPELKFLTQQDWLNAAWDADLNTDDGVRLALSKLRDEAVDHFFDTTRKVLKKYLAENNDILPANLLALKPYYDTPITDDMLERYVFTQVGKLSSDRSEPVIRKAVYADTDYDSNQEMSMNGASGGSFDKFHDAIYDAVMAFTMANYGQTPNDPSQIGGYLKKSIDTVTMQKYFSQITADIAANPPPPEVIALAPVLKAYEAANNGQLPGKPADLSPYITTPDQQAALQKAEQNYPESK